MSVTRPTLNPLPLDELDEVVLVVLLLLLPHAAAISATTTIATTPRPRCFVLLLITASPFVPIPMRNLSREAGPGARTPNLVFIVKTIIRAQLAHTPRSPFTDAEALETFEDGGLAFDGERIIACGPYSAVRGSHPDVELHDAREAILLPGFVDCHVHYPQLRVIGAMGLELLEWLRLRALPEEVRLADASYAADVAERFVRGLAAHGTTTTLVFGSHFEAAQEALFAAAEAAGLRVASGLVASDRGLLPELHVGADAFYERGRRLIERWHGRGLLRYAITPRFSVSCSEEMLEACSALGSEADEVLVTTHLNETVQEIGLVDELFPWATDYLETYERYGLVGPQSVFAHDVHPTDGELRRLASLGAAVAHCPSSNAFLGSGLFPLQRHLDAGVRVALGTDVGAGTGLSMLKEGLVAYQGQMLAPDGCPLTPGHLLYLATAAGAAALGVADQVGDFGVGKSADFVLVKAPEGSTLEAVLDRSESIEDKLGALFTLARDESIVEVRVGGRTVWPSPAGSPQPTSPHA